MTSLKEEPTLQRLLSYLSKRVKYRFDQKLKTAWPTKILMPFLTFSDNYLLLDAYLFFKKVFMIRVDNNTKQTMISFLE